MGRIDDIFAELRGARRKALMPFVCAGHPAPGALGGMLGELERAGASAVEVGIPFSDPIADGPVIAAAMHEALEQGATPERVLEEIAEARSDLSIGLIAMVSVSIVRRLGGEAGFCSACARAGFDGLIVPDLPVDEAEDVAKAAGDAGLSLSLLVAPTTTDERAERIVNACSGFVYLLARVGITGERDAAPQIEDHVLRLRNMTNLPIACGFGISTAEHVRAVVQHADAAIVGSALVRHVDQASRAGEDPVAAAGEFTRRLAAGLA